jgi:glycosyltransferase involved in cell wall biosynthesis
MNKGVALASGQYVCMMNSDDWCTPNAAEIVAKRYAETHADVISGLVTFHDSGKFKSEGRNSFLFPNNVLVYPGYFHQGLYASNNAFEKSGYFDVDYYPVSDYNWTSLCVTKGLKFDMWDEILAFYTQGEGTATAESNRRAQESYLKLTQETFPFLSSRQANIYHHTLFVCGAARRIWERELTPCLRAVKDCLKNDALFRICTYRIVLYGYYEIFRLAPSYDIFHDRGSRRKLVNWFRVKIEEKCTNFAGAYTPLDISKVILKKLEESIACGNDDLVSYEDLLEFARLKSIFNRYLRKYYKTEAPIHRKLMVMLKVPMKWILYHSGVFMSKYVKRRLEGNWF